MIRLARSLFEQEDGQVLGRFRTQSGSMAEVLAREIGSAAEALFSKVWYSASRNLVCVTDPHDSRCWEV